MKVPTPLTPYIETAKLVGAVLLGCLLLWGGQKVLSWKDAAEEGARSGRQAQAASGITQDGAKADDDRAATDAGVAGGRDTFNNDYDEGVRNEPQVAARADRVVPQRVRNAFEQRRRNRERLGCAGEQCEPGPAPAPPAER